MSRTLSIKHKLTIKTKKTMNSLKQITENIIKSRNNNQIPEFNDMKDLIECAIWLKDENEDKTKDYNFSIIEF
tara:strand:- start:1089 stop:1307 length:219 start_codon:yes stop_codon:yes gene_type:complete